MNDKLIGKTVLITDDDERNIYALSMYLENADMKVLTARDGSEAIAVLNKQEKIDIILLDMMMPVMDGFETMQAIQEEGKYIHIPIIAVTAKAMKGDREKCLEAGAWDYIAKPIDMNLLLDKMTRWLQ
jgi:CheY-like chemotaxis protein